MSSNLCCTTDGGFVLGISSQKWIQLEMESTVNATFPVRITGSLEGVKARTMENVTGNTILVRSPCAQSNFIKNIIFQIVCSIQHFSRFLQGACVNEKCLLSHNVSPEKMPTCKFYLEGICSKDNCPYLHVKISPKADICRDFLEGYCKMATKVMLFSFQSIRLYLRKLRDSTEKKVHGVHFPAKIGDLF